MYAITGATGNTGRPIAEKLLEAGKQVRVIGRSKERLESLVQKGAEAFECSLDDGDALARAFQGVQAVYSMIPPNLTVEGYRAYQNGITAATVTGIREAGVKYAVTLSSVGADRPDKNGPIGGLHDHEQALNQIEGLNVVHLRPGYFMENLFFNIDPMKEMGIAVGSIEPGVSQAMIATRDIAEAAVEYLLKLDFSGTTVRELLGERDLTLQEATKVLGVAIDREEINYVQFPYKDAEKAMTDAGLSRDVAALMTEMEQSINEGIIKPLEKRSPDNTTSTSIEWFAREVFAPAFED